MWYRNTFFKYTAGIILVLLAIFLFTKTAFLLTPVWDFVSALFCPLLIAGVLYYILRPGVRFLHTYLRLPKWSTILLMYGLIAILLVMISSIVIPTLTEQFQLLTSATAEKFKEVKEKTIDFMAFFDPKINRIETIQSIFAIYLNKLQQFLMNNLLDTVTTIAHCAILMTITPFILYYFLKDDSHLFRTMQKLVPTRYLNIFNTLVRHVDLVLSSFIVGQMLIASAIGVLLWIGYTLIGLESAFLLAIFASVFFTIPIIGSIIALIPALLVGLSVSGFMAFKVMIVMSVVLLLESNLISPQVMSHRLNVHPLVIVLVMLAGGSLYGILGLFLATPLCAVTKAVFTDLHHFYYNGELLNGSNLYPLAIRANPKKKPDSKS